MKKRNTEVQPIRSIREMMEIAVTQNPNLISYQYQNGKELISVTTLEFYDSVENLGAKLTEMGFGRSHIACVGENSYPWIQTFLMSLMTAGVFVPIDKELPADNMIYLLNESDSEIVFCSEKYEKIFADHRAELPCVKKIVCFERADHEGDFLSFRRLIAEGAKLDRAAYDSLKSDANELKYLVYTSGTTGIAKGVMLTEHNLCCGIYYGLLVSSIYEKGLSVLPYHHTYEAVCELLVSIHHQTTICINDSLRHVQKNLQFYRPTHIYLVPAFSDHFYNSIWSTVRKQGKEKLFRRMLKLSDGLRKIGIDLRRVFFRSILKQFGGKLRRIVCGGAPIRPEVGAFFDQIGIALTGGYGITECSPLVSVNDDDKTNNFSSAGHHLACLQWKINDPIDGIGEICVKGDVVMLGYYKRPDLTAEAIQNGWFYTGDYGYINEKDEIVITGRKKNIIVLSNGKNIYPEEMELRMQQALPYLTEVVVSGIRNEHGQDTGLAAECYIADETINREKVPGDIRAALSALPAYKQILNITFRAEPFPKTTSNKIKRG